MKLKEKNNPAGAVGAKPMCLPTEENILDSLRGSSVSFWIDSSGGPKDLCNLSFYGTEPKYYFYGYLNKIYFAEPARFASEARRASGRAGESIEFNVNCFDFLEEKINEEKNNKDGIFVGYFSYDLFQRGLEVSGSCGLPDFFFAFFENIKSLKSDSSITVRPPDLQTSGPPDLSSNMADPEYLRKVKQIKEEIKAGNVYQVNLTREYFIEQSAISPQQSELELYLKLREASPNPYSCYFKTPFLTILSSSPEEFLYVEAAKQRDGETASRTIRTRPIKGTLPNNVFEIDPKNKAENIMIVDLERNDLGKICEYGSVTTKSLLNIESYKHLNHIVSTVHGKLKPDVTLRQIFEALFPGGSISGAPKIAAMKLIEKIEPTKRGAYTGSFGYIKTDGTMNFNILIRTIFIQTSDLRPQKQVSGPRPQVTFNVGGGIVADSDPQSELEEIKLKAKGIMSALGLC